MGFLKKLFGGGSEPKKYVDKRGIYFYVHCDTCGTITRIRADMEYDLSRTDNGYSWYKTIVDSRCFRPMAAVVQLDNNYQPISQELSGGSFISEAEYKSFLEPVMSSDPDDVGDATEKEVVDQ